MEIRKADKSAPVATAPALPKKKHRLRNAAIVATLLGGGAALLFNNHTEPAPKPKTDTTAVPDPVVDPHNLTARFYTVKGDVYMMSNDGKEREHLKSGSCVSPFTIVAEDAPGGLIQVTAWTAEGDSASRYVPTTYLKPVTDNRGESDCVATFLPR